MHRLDELVSKWCMFGGVVLIEVSIVGGIIKALGKRLATPLRKNANRNFFFNIWVALRITSSLTAIKSDPTRNAVDGSSFCECYFVISRLRVIATSNC